VRATADVTTPEQFENIVIGGNDQAARRRDGDARRDTGRRRCAPTARPASASASSAQAESNTLDISPRRRAAVAEHPEDAARGHVDQGHQRRRRLRRGAMHEVEIALALSVSIVLLVIYIFLLDWRATLIPGLSPCRWR
jgi:HAE1 family hydrophobic/amphiphilic exporter-1